MRSMRRATKTRKAPSAEALARMAGQGKDISRHFSNQGRMMPAKAVQKVNVDFGVDMLKELDELAEELNVSRQAVIKTVIRQALDQHHLAGQARGMAH